MGIKLKREKNRIWLITIIYRLSKMVQIGARKRFKLFLDLEWIFNRLAHEESFKYYSGDMYFLHPVRVYSMPFILDNLNEDDVIVDVGCNYGKISYYLAEKAKKVIGIDYDRKAIEYAREKYKKENLEFICEDALDYLGRNEDRFDVLILSHVLEHLDDAEYFINKFHVFFDRIYIEVPDYDNSYLNHYRQDVGTELIYTDADHTHEYDRDEMRSLLEKCGLEISTVEFRFGVQKIWCNCNH